MTKNEWTYSMRHGDVVITTGGSPEYMAAHELILNKARLERAILNVKSSRDHYKTSMAWRAQLDKYEGALAFLDSENDNR